MGEIGEFHLIDRIRKILPVSRNRDLLVDIGDDTAVVRLDGRRAVLLTCDIQVEGRHFRFDRTTPYQVGRRAMAVNLSDIASMGGKPTYALVSLGLPADFPVRSYDRLFEGMRDELLPHRAHIIGGNLARTEERLVVDVTLVGEADPSRVLTRSGARDGAPVAGIAATLGRASLKPLPGPFISPPAAEAAGPALASMLIYLLMAVVLAVRPEGLFPAKSG